MNDLQQLMDRLEEGWDDDTWEKIRAGVTELEQELEVSDFLASKLQNALAQMLDE